MFITSGQSLFLQWEWWLARVNTCLPAETLRGKFDVKIMNKNFQFHFFLGFRYRSNLVWDGLPRLHFWHFNLPNRLIGHDSSADPFPFHFIFSSDKLYISYHCAAFIKAISHWPGPRPGFNLIAYYGEYQKHKAIPQIDQSLRQHKQCENCWQLCRISGCCCSQRRRQVSSLAR